MKLGICCNFSWPHIGGSESVIQSIAESLVFDMGYEVTIFTFSEKVETHDFNLHRVPCLKGKGFIKQINQMDHVMVYSDSFWEWETIVSNIDRIKPKVTIVLVGMYNMFSNEHIYDMFRGDIHRYNVVTHSADKSYETCLSDDIPVMIIPNGVDLDEFREDRVDFRKKYGIKENHIILNVANFFYGKGQEEIPLVCDELDRRFVGTIENWAVVSISSSIQYPYEKRFIQKYKSLIKPYNNYFLRNIPREDVVAAFKESDVFLFTSKKEVSPLVILEAEAAGLPWISADVGDIMNRKGGEVIGIDKVDERGYKVFTPSSIKCYAKSVERILTIREWRDQLREEGQKGIEERDWKNIVPMYHEVFNG